MRTFISIEIPDKLHSKIKNIQREIPKFKGKLTELKNLHLTLKFLGDVSEEQALEIRRCLHGVKFKKFKARLSEVGVFTENYIRIIWIKIDGVDELQKQVDSCLKHMFPIEERFMSHLTIARVKEIDRHNKHEFLEKIKKIRLNEEFEVKEFKLMKSELAREGPIYKPIDKFELE